MSKSPAPKLHVVLPFRGVRPEVGRENEREEANLDFVPDDWNRGARDRPDPPPMP